MSDLKKIAIIVDSPNWAFDIGAKLIKKELKDIYDVEIFYQKTNDKELSLFEMLEKTKDFDIIHFCWRKTLLQFEESLFYQEVEKQGKDYESYVAEKVNKISTGVYDHLFLNEEEFQHHSKIFNKYCSSYIVCSKRLYEIYSNKEGIPKPWGILMDTVDGEKFIPKNIKRFKDTKKTLEIGWVGNSQWNINDGKQIDYKGFKTIIEPVITELSKTHNIKPNFADKKISPRANDDMPNYYSEIDLLLCSSFCEGTPRPIVEALACGVPIITTDVGIVNEVLGKKQRKFIIKERTQEAFKEKLLYIYSNRNALNKLSKENIKSRTKQISSARKKLYIKYFGDFLSNTKG